MRVTSRLVVLGFGISLLEPSSSWAQSGAAAGGIEPIAVAVASGLDCVDAAGFFARIRHRTRRVREAEVGVASRRFVLHFEGRDEVTGELLIYELDGSVAARSVVGEGCEVVVNALSLVAAVAVDPDAARTSASGDLAESSVTDLVPESLAAELPLSESKGSIVPPFTSESPSTSLAPPLDVKEEATVPGDGNREVMPLNSAVRSPEALSAPAHGQVPGAKKEREGSPSKSSPDRRGSWEHGLGPVLVMTLPLEQQGALGVGAQWWTLRERSTHSDGPLLSVTGIVTFERELAMPQDSRLPQSASVGYQIYGVQGDVCPIGGRFHDVVSLLPCLSGFAGMLRASPVSIPGRGNTDWGSWVTLGIELRPVVRIGRDWAVMGAVGAAIPLLRPVVIVQPDLVLAEATDWGLGASIGVAWRWSE